MKTNTTKSTKSPCLCEVKSSRLNLIKSTWGLLGVILASSGVTFLYLSDSQAYQALNSN